MAYASILCETCENKSNTDCYCAPNSTCSKYKDSTKGTAGTVGDSDASNKKCRDTRRNSGTVDQYTKKRYLDRV